MNYTHHTNIIYNTSHTIWGEVVLKMSGREKALTWTLRWALSGHCNVVVQHTPSLSVAHGSLPGRILKYKRSGRRERSCFIESISSLCPGFDRLLCVPVPESSGP